MSKYVECNTQIMNEKALIAALHEMGYTDLKVGQNIPLMGYEGRQRKERADVVIPRKYVRAAANDIGFKKQADGTFKAIVSEFDMGQDPKFVQNVSQLSGLHNSIMAAEQEGWACKRIKNKHGEEVLELERWS